jgi:hypothetical protein
LASTVPCYTGYQTAGYQTAGEISSYETGSYEATAYETGFETAYETAEVSSLVSGPTCHAYRDITTITTPEPVLVKETTTITQPEITTTTITHPPEIRTIVPEDTVTTTYVYPEATATTATAFAFPTTAAVTSTYFDTSVSKPVQAAAYSLGGIHTEVSRSLNDPVIWVTDSMAKQRQRLALIDEQIMMAGAKVDVLRSHATSMGATRGDKRLYKKALHDHKKICAHRNKIVRKL